MPSAFVIGMTTPVASSQNSRSADFQACFESLEHIRVFVGQAAQDFGLNDAAVYAVQLAVDEACTNIIEHAYGGECEQQIHCTCEDQSQGLKIVLCDCGEPFDPSSVPEPDFNSKLEDRQIGGLGLYFMHRMMDEVHFEFIPHECNGNGCNQLTMIKHKEPQP